MITHYLLTYYYYSFSVDHSLSDDSFGLMNIFNSDSEDKENNPEQNQVVKPKNSAPKRNSLVESTNFNHLDSMNFTQQSPEPSNTTVATKSTLSPIEVLMREQHLDAAAIQQFHSFTEHLREQSTARTNILKDLVKKNEQ